MSDIGEITLEQANWIKSQIHVSGLPTPGQFVGEFKVVSKLGQGGMGAVFHAIHSGRDVALKIVTAQQTPETLIRFENEAKALGMLPSDATVLQSKASTQVFLASYLYRVNMGLGEWASRCMPRASIIDRALTKFTGMSVMGVMKPFMADSAIGSVG